MNRPKISKDINSLIKNLPTKPKTDDFTSELYQKFKEELTAILLPLFQNIEAEGMLPNSFYKPAFLWSKAKEEHCKRRKLQTKNPDQRRYKNSQQITSKPNSIAYLKAHTPQSSGICPKMQDHSARVIDVCDAPP